MRIRIVVTKV